MNHSKYHGKDKIWRYMSIEKFLDFFLNKRLCFARIDQLNDPSEGMLYANYKNFELLKKPLTSIKIDLKSLVGLVHPNTLDTSYNAVLKSSKDFFIYKPPMNIFSGVLQKEERDVWKRIYVNCWHVNKDESVAMWKIYSEERGIAIQSTIESLDKSITEKYNVLLCEIQYDDNLEAVKHLPRDNRQFFFKKKPYSYEQEIRCLYYDSLSPYNDNETKKILYIDVDLKILNPKVIVSPFVEKWVVDLIKKILNEFGDEKLFVLQSDLLSKQVKGFNDENIY